MTDRIEPPTAPALDVTNSRPSPPRVRFSSLLLYAVPITVTLAIMELSSARHVALGVAGSPRSFWSQVASVVVPHNPNDFWTLVTGLASAVLIFVAWKGLASLRVAQESLQLTQDSLRLTQEGLKLTQDDLALTQRDMFVRATREGRACAVARCEEFAGVLIPLRSRINSGMSAVQTPVFVKATDAAEVRFNPDNTTLLEAAEAWWTALPLEVRTDSVRLLNLLEAWAMHFTHQLGDSKIAFGPCATQFCSTVVQLYACLLRVRATPNRGKYPNVVQLYETWIAQLEEEQRGLVTGNLLKQLADLQAKEVPKPTLPKVLGT